MSPAHPVGNPRLSEPSIESGRRRRVLMAGCVVVGLTTCCTAASVDRTGLCPVVSDARRVVSMDGVEIGPPASAEAEAAALAQLVAEDRDERLRAAISLGLAGSLPAFHQLLAARDDQGLMTYSSFYVNRDGHACVAAEIEDALLENVDDPVLRPALLPFLGKNLYTRRELFDRLIRIDLADGRPDDFARVVRALTATLLEGVEDEVLAQAESYLGHDTPVLKRVLPGVHRTYLKYFAERTYLPSIGYMERLLQIEGYGETLDSFIAEFSVTRSTVYHALDRFPSPLVGEVFTRQLERIVLDCPPELVSYELSAFGRYAVRHAETDDLSRRVAGSLAALLGQDPPSDEEEYSSRPGVDYPVHKKVVELLADLGTTEAAAALIRELHGVAERRDRSAAAMIAHTLDALVRVPSATDVDVPRFLLAAKKLPMVNQLHHVPLVLDAYPDPAAQDFYLAQMGWILDNRLTFETTFHLDPSKALWGVIKRLLVFDEPEQLAATRDEVDRLFLAGLLDEKSYLRASDAVNEPAGGRSAVYEQLMERHRVAREAEVERRRAEARAESLRIVDDNTSPEGIRRNLQLLGEPGSGSRQAASWLVIAGPKILPPAHERLADPASSPELVFRLMQVLGEIGDPSSSEPLIEAVRGDVDNRALLRAGLRALGLMPPSKAGFELARGLLTGDHPASARQAALVYLASVRDGRGAAIAQEYSANTVELDVRVAALLLAARLGLGHVKPVIIELLQTTQDRSHGEVLVRALGELTTPEELNALTVRLPLHRDRPYFEELLLLVDFRYAEGDRRVELARRLIETDHPWDRREAVRSLIEDGPTDVLFEYLQLHPAMGLPLERSVVYSPVRVSILAQIRRLGYGIEEAAEGFVLVRVD